jgi:hypothetical protein
MTTRLIRTLLALLALLSALLVASATSIAAGTATAAEYCVNTTPTYYGDKQITPAGHYCVPAP